MNIKSRFYYKDFRIISKRYNGKLQYAIQHNSELYTYNIMGENENNNLEFVACGLFLN